MRAPRAGFTLVEVVVAVLVLTAGLLGLVGCTAAVLRAMGYAARQARADSAARLRVEWLASRSCAALADGSARDGELEEQWRARVDSLSRTAAVSGEVSYLAGGRRR